MTGNSCLDTLLTALYVELTDSIISSLGSGHRGPRTPPEVTDAELSCLAVAQVLLRYDDSRPGPAQGLASFHIGIQDAAAAVIAV